MSMLSSVLPATPVAQASGTGEGMNAREGSVAAQNGSDTNSAWTRPFHSFLTTNLTTTKNTAAKTAAILFPSAPGSIGASGHARTKLSAAQSPSLPGPGLIAPPVNTPALAPVLSVSGAAMAAAASAYASATVPATGRPPISITPPGPSAGRANASGVIAAAPATLHTTVATPMPKADSVAQTTTTGVKAFSAPVVNAATKDAAAAIASTANAPVSADAPASAPRADAPVSDAATPNTKPSVAASTSAQAHDAPGADTSIPLVTAPKTTATNAAIPGSGTNETSPSAVTPSAATAGMTRTIADVVQATAPKTPAVNTAPAIAAPNAATPSAAAASVPGTDPDTLHATAPKTPAVNAAPTIAAPNAVLIDVIPSAPAIVGVATPPPSVLPERPVATIAETPAVQTAAALKSPGLAALTTVAMRPAANAGSGPVGTLKDILGTSGEVKGIPADIAVRLGAPHSEKPIRTAAVIAVGPVSEPSPKSQATSVPASVPDASVSNAKAVPVQTPTDPQPQAPSSLPASGHSPAQTSAKPGDPGRKAVQSASKQNPAASPAAPIPAPGAGTNDATVAAAVPTPVVSQTVAAPMNRPSLLTTTSTAERVQIVNQVAQQIQALHNPNTPQANTVTMQLHPDQWGPVTISVTTHGAEDGRATVSAAVTTAHGDAQTLLRQNSQDLKDALSSAGLRLDKLDIQTATVVAASASHGADARRQGRNDAQSGAWTGSPQHGASPQMGSQGGQQGFASAFGQGQSQRQAFNAREPIAQASTDGRIAPLGTVSARINGIDLHA